MSHLNVWSMLLTAVLAALLQVNGQEPKSPRDEPKGEYLFVRSAQEPSEAQSTARNSARNSYVQREVVETKPANLQGYYQHLFFNESAGPRTGLDLAPLDDATRAHLKLSKEEGLLVIGVAPHSPVVAAGIAPNDILLTLDEAPLSRPEDLETHLKAAVDKLLSLTFLRQGQKKTIKVQPQVSVTFGPVQAETTSYWIGVNVNTLDPVLRSQLSVPGGSGLIATEVVPDGPAAKAGVKAHDILLSLAGTPLRDQSALVEAVQKNGEKTADLAIIREGSRQTIEVKPEKRSTKSRLSRTWQGVDNYRFQLARPGAVLQFNPSGTGPFPNVANSLQSTSPVGVWTAESPAEKRLETMDGELKELRKAVEELTKALKERR